MCDRTYEQVSSLNPSQTLIALLNLYSLRYHFESLLLNQYFFLFFSILEDKIQQPLKKSNSAEKNRPLFVYSIMTTPLRAKGSLTDIPKNRKSAERKPRDIKNNDFVTFFSIAVQERGKRTLGKDGWKRA